MNFLRGYKKRHKRRIWGAFDDDDDSDDDVPTQQRVPFLTRLGLSVKQFKRQTYYYKKRPFILHDKRERRRQRKQQNEPTTTTTTTSDGARPDNLSVSDDEPNIQYED